MTLSEKERLLCYTAGIIGSTIANPQYGQLKGGLEVSDWLIARSIKTASKLIDTIMDDEKLKEVLNEDQAG
jgi:hypothetical protein